jgi:hypothetical protein
MRSRISKLLFCYALTLGTAVWAGAAQASVIVSGSADIFAAGLTTPIPGTDTSGNPGGNGSAPPSVAVVSGQTLVITATGIVNCCDTSPTPGTTGPNGFATNPFGGSGSTITDSIPTSTIGTYNSGTGAFALVGVFTGGAVSTTPFTIGSNDMITVPTGATMLYFGFADAAGFNGPSGFYQDNSGELTVTASAVPETSTWAMMILGFFGIGYMAVRRRKCGAEISLA